MKLGLSFTARSADLPDTHVAPPAGHVPQQHSAAQSDVPDDLEEEYDSLETIGAIADTLRGLGHEVELIGDGRPAIERLIRGAPPDLVFNIAEGRGVSRCREAWMPALLEQLGIPFTGSDALTMSATLDKDCAKRLVAGHGVAIPRGVLVGEGELPVDRLRELAFPVIVKPACEGSSKGIRAANLVNEPEELVRHITELRRLYRQPILAEEFIDGDELTVGLVGNPPEVLGIMRVLPQQATGPFVYSLEVKRDWQRQVSYESPAQLPPEHDRAVRDAALASWHALGCRDIARIDFRLRAGVPYFLEANPLPGLSPVYSDLVILARGVGIEYPQLLARVLAAAQNRVWANA